MRLLHNFISNLSFVSITILIISAVCCFSVSCEFSKKTEGNAVGAFDKDKYSEPPVYDDSVVVVLQATPTGNLLSTEGRKEIYVVFNHPMVPLATIDEETKGVFSITPAVNGKFRWYGSRICSFIPDEGWSAGKEYTVKIPAGLKSLNGKKLDKEFVFKFNVEVPELEVRCSPYNYDTIDYDQTFTLRFNYPVSRRALAGYLILRSGKRIIPYTLTSASGDNYDDEYGSEKTESNEESSRVIIVKPQASYDRDGAVTVEVKEGLRALNNEAIGNETKTFEYKTHGPLKVTFDDSASYYQELWNNGFNFTNLVDLKEATGAIRFSPPVELREKPSGRSKRIGLAAWKVKAGTKYKISVGLITDIYGNRSSKPLDVEISIPDYYPDYYIESSVNLLESEAGRRLPIEIINVQKLSVGAGSYSLKDIQAKLEGGYKYNITENIAYKYTDWVTGLKKNQSGRLGYDVSQYLNRGKYGWVALKFSGTVYDAYNNKFEEKSQAEVIQATNLAVVVKEDFFTLHAWVSNLSDGAARGGIKLTVLDTSTEIGSGVTDSSGYCAISKKKPGMYDKAIFLASDGTGDMTYLTTVDNDISMWGLASYNVNACDSVISGEIIFDRKLYRPGDEVFFKCVLAERFNGKLRAPAGRQVTVSIDNASGDNVFKETIAASANGGIWGSWKIPSDAPLGHYQVNIITSAGSKRQQNINDTFQVEEFRPVVFTVEIDGIKDGRAGEKLNLSVSGNYLFGAPMGNAPVSWNISRSSKNIYFDRYEGYAFGDNSYWIEESSNHSGRGSYFSGTGRLSGGGKKSLDVPLKQMVFSEKINIPDVVYTMGDPYEMAVEATVKDVDDKSVTKTENLTVYPGNFLLGIKQNNSYQSFKNEFSFDLVAVSNTGDKISSRKCDVRIVKNIWKSIKTKGPEGSLQTRNTLVKELVDSRTVKISSDPLKFKYRPQSPGIYTITVQESGGLTYSRAGFYAYGGDFSSWNFNDDDSVAVIPDKKSYRPGETAKVLIQSPFKNCNAIITLERENIYWRKIVALDGKGTPVSIPIKEEYTPNVYLSVMLVKPRVKPDDKASPEVRKSFDDNDLGAPKFKAGIATLHISTESRSAKLDITTDRESYGPGDKMKIRIKTEPGAEVALSVADRGVLDLINYVYRNPLEQFYKDWPLGVRIFHNMNMIIRQYKYALKGGSPGGSGESDEYGSAIEGEMPGGGGFALKNEDGTRKDIKYTAYWNPGIVADNNGYAEVEFKLPDNLTTFRIMALASANGKYRDFKREFKVRKAMVIQKNVPRFIRTGDRLKIGAVVVNQTGIEGKFKVSLESDLLKDKMSAETVVIKPGEAKEILFPATLDNRKYAGLHKKITDAIRSGNTPANSDINVRGYLTVEPVDPEKFTKAGFAPAEVKDRLLYEFPVRENPVEEAFTLAGFTDGNASEVIRIPGDSDIFPELGGLSVNLSSSALIGITRGFKFYQSNPYFCLEQRASAFLLMMSSGKLLSEFSYRPPDDKSYDFANIQKLFLSEIGDFKNADGGFRLWKEMKLDRGERSDPYLTSYVAFVLLTARSRGYDVDGSMIDGAMAFLKKYMKEPAKDGYSYILESMSFINYTFALAGSRDESVSRVLLERRKELSLRANALLALSLSIQRGVKKYTDDSDIKGIMETFKNSIEITTRNIMFKERGGGSYLRAFYSEGSTLALILQCFMRLDGANPLIPGMVQHIIDSRGNRYWGDTHSTGLLALALDEYRERYEKTGTGDMTGSVLINSKEVFRETFRKDSLSLYTSSKSFDELYSVVKSGVDYPLEFKKSGGGRLYYAATLQYYPLLKETASRDEGMEIRRTIYDLSSANDKNRYGLEVKGTLKRGEIYLCRLIVVNPKPYFNAVIVDPLPSTVEILNTSFATEKQSLSGFATAGSGNDDYWWSYSSPVIEYRDDRVVITQNYMYPGMHEYYYLIRPVIHGDSGAPSATVKLMYEPEVFGRTGSSIITVK